MMFSILSVLLGATLACASPPECPSHTLRPVSDRDAALNAPDRRVRTTDPAIQALLVQGVRRSTTFASLVTELNRTDVIVYIETSADLQNSIAGQLQLVHATPHNRYLRIQVAPKGGPKDQIATIGHELYHALEVANDPHVRDQAEFARLYRRIGHPGRLAHFYDTVAAGTTGRTVRHELGS